MQAAAKARSPETRKFGWFLAVLLVSSGTVSAENPCQNNLQEAEESYLAGHFGDVPDLLAPCFERQIPKVQRAAAHALAAKNHLANDDLTRATGAIRSLLALTPDFTAGFRDPVTFARIVENEKRLGAVVNVASVSKVDEPLSEAPATVVVVTAEEIERRGYLDLEQVLYDLPGFDISRGNGDVYSNFYQRGFRSNANERTLLLVDGVEQNHLMSNTAYLSRQYALSNIDRVEVIYGPASTMYGPNAYTGVISIQTKSPEALIPEGKSFGFSGQTAIGELGTRLIDLTVAGRTASLSWSLTGRTFHADEPDLSGFSDWDYDPSFADTFDYDRAFGIPGPDALSDTNVQELVKYGLIECDSPQVLCQPGPGGEVVSVELTEAGRRQVAAYDRALIASGGFDDFTRDWSVSGKVQLGRLSLGVQAWALQEGTAPWYTDRSRDGRQESWSPRQLAIFANYSRTLNDRWSLAFSSRYKRHDLGADSKSARYELLANRVGANEENLSVLSVFGIEYFEQYSLIGEARIRFEEASSQFRNELTLVYQPSRRLTVVSGLEVRNSSIQSSLLTTDIGGNENDFILGFDFLTTGDKIEQSDLGLYFQASYRVNQSLKCVGGARLDYNRLENIDSRFTAEETLVDLQGFGTVFNPRLALVYSPENFVFKAIYAEAFKEPSFFERFNDSADRQANYSLEPEKAENLEISGLWQPNEDLSLEVSAYQARYSTLVSSTVQLVEFKFGGFPLSFFSIEGRFNNLGPLLIRGAHINASWRRGSVQLTGNYTYTDPRSPEPRDTRGRLLSGVDELRVADMAEHRLNLGVAIERQRFDLHVAGNYVGRRRTGEGTTALENPFREIDEYFSANATLTYRSLLKGMDVQLIVRNLFDEEYFHPGVQGADGVNFAARLPQPGRVAFLRFIYKM